MGLFFTLLMTYGGAVIGLVRPYYGFLIYVCFSIIRPDALWHWSVPQGNYSKIIAIAFLLGWALNGFGNWNFGAARRPALSLLAFLGWAAVSTAFCQFPEVGLRFLENMSKIIIPCLAALTLIRTRRDLYLLTWTIVGSMGYLAFDLNMSYYDGFNRLQEVGFGGMDNNSLTIGLVTGVGFSFFLGLSESIWWRRYLAFAASALMTHAVFFSFSRGGMLGLIFVGVATAIVIPKTRANLSFLTLGTILAFAMAGPQVWERFSSITNNSLTGAEATESSAESRLYLWEICSRMVAENPIFGKGPDHFPLLVQNYQISWAERAFFPEGKEAHTLWLQIAAEMGIPELAFLAGYYLLTLKAIWPLVRHDNFDSQGLTEGATARMVWAALVGFFLSAQFVSLEGLELPYYITLVGLGTLIQLEPVLEVEENTSEALLQKI